MEAPLNLPYATKRPVVATADGVLTYDLLDTETGIDNLELLPSCNWGTNSQFKVTVRPILGVFEAKRVSEGD